MVTPDPARSADGPLLVRSRYLVLVPATPELTLCAHAVFGARRLLGPETVALLGLFATPRTAAEAIAAGLAASLWEEWLSRWPQPAGDGPAQALQRCVADLADHGLLVAAGCDEEALVRRRVAARYAASAERAWGVEAVADAFAPVLPLRPADRPGAAPATERVHFLLLGWCVTQALAPLLREAAAARGLDAAVEVAFHDDLGLIAERRPDVTVLQLGHRLLLAPVLDGFAELPAETLAERLATAEAAIDRAVDEAAQRAGDRLLLVQGIASPQVSPLGVLDARHPVGFAGAVQRLDRRARAAAGRWSNALFVDEEALAAREGKRWLLDDLVAPSSHHGARDPAGYGGSEAAGPRAPLGSPLPLQRLLVDAYLDLFEVWRGRDAIRCVAVDLDGTLWPGEIAADDFRFDAEALTQPLMYGRFGGLHEALQALRRRGILLAAVSRNDRATVLAKWRPDDVPLAFGASAADTGHYLRPDDFVALEIGWGRKSDALRRLAADLGITLGQLAFVDDHPVEREEVRQALPEVLVLGDDPERLRELLLTSPRLQVLHAGAEAHERTATTRARLARESERAASGDHAAFLASLGVRCRVARESGGERLARVAELLRRTTQLSTTPWRPAEAELHALAERPGVAIWSLDVEDRFARYGLAGAAVVEGARVRALAVSCRVLGLEVEPVLLRRALAAAAAHGPETIVELVPTERNLPARRLVALPGFEPLPGGGGYRYDLRRHPLPADPCHCEVVESAADRDAGEPGSAAGAAARPASPTSPPPEAPPRCPS